MVDALNDVDWNCVQVWRVVLGEFIEDALLAELWSYLSAEERDRAERFHGADLRQDYIVCHAALRSILGHCLGLSPKNIPFRFEPAAVSGGAAGGAATGKPALALRSGSAQTRLDLRFNLSHTRGAALIAVALGREVGIDIEWQRPMDDLDGMARAVMSDEEYGQWLALEQDSRTIAFYRLWTRKESYLKAIGLGLYRDLHDVTVPVSPEFLEPSHGVTVKDRTGQGLWTVGDVAVDEPWAASICCEGAELPSVVLRNWKDFNPAQISKTEPDRTL